MAKAKAPKEILEAKERLEQKLTAVLYDVILYWQEEYLEWTVSEVDLSVIDVSAKNEHLFIPATAVVALTKKDGTMTISKHGTVKETT